MLNLQSSFEHFVWEATKSLRPPRLYRRELMVMESENEVEQTPAHRHRCTSVPEDPFDIETQQEKEFSKHDHVRVIKSIHNPCSLARSNHITDPQHAAEVRDLIMNELSFSSVEKRLTRDFQKDDLTSQRIMHAFELLDKHFYGSSILSTIKKKGIEIAEPKIYAFVQEKLQPSMKTVCYSKIGQFLPSKLELHLNLNRFGDSAQSRVTNGIIVRNKLDSLLITLSHELVHFILYVWCRNKQGHGETFKKLNHSIHGADKDAFGYYDLNSDH